MRFGKMTMCLLPFLKPSSTMVSFIRQMQLEPWATLKLLGFSQVVFLFVLFPFVEPCGMIGFRSYPVFLGCIRQVGVIISMAAF